MKRFFLAAVLVTAFCTISFGRKLVAEGKTYTTLGNYKIESADNQIPLKGQDCKAYIISYENSPMEVTVAVCKDRKCKRYIVISDKLSVQYVCNNSYFGVEKLDKSFMKDGIRTSDTAMNRSEYFHQKVLTPGKSGELEATQLIAAYFPRLLNDVSDAVASR
ncbi:MAG: hypothetical protein WAL29_02980 [Bacteroidales bacterium]